MQTMLRGYIYRCRVVFFALCISVIKTNAQTDSVSIKEPPGKVFATRAMYGSIVIHTKFIANTAGARPRAIEFETAKQYSDSATWRKCYCYPRTGIVINLTDFDSHILGKSYSATYFIEPNYRLGSNASFFIKAGGGLSYLTKPFDSLKNPENHTYSLPVNFFLNLGTGISYHVSPKLSIDAMISFNHNSNGDFAIPNRGINWYGGSIALRYYKTNNVLPHYKKETDKSWKKEKPSIETGIFYSPKSGYTTNGTPQRKTLVGTGFQYSKRVSLISALSLSAEIYYDGAMASTKNLFMDNSSSVLAGIMAGHEFVFRRIIFSQQLGIYVHKHTETLNLLNNSHIQIIYHRWGLRYKLSQHWYAGFNFLAHRNIADFIDARLIYRF